MSWSISESRNFRACQRRWCIKNCVASATATKDPRRRYAYLLGKLQSVSAWRGQIVDHVLSKYLIPKLNAREHVSLDELVGLARQVFDLQREFALNHTVEDLVTSPASYGDQFCVLHALQYGNEVSQAEFSRAWSEIETSFQNLFSMDALWQELRASQYCIAQRNLSFKHSGMTVRAVPDVIVFYDDSPPLVIDWKVHAFGIQDAWLQLGIYALALSSCKAHRDFPQIIHRINPTDIRLAEVQLLKSRVRRYELNEDDVDLLDAYIAESACSMQIALDEVKLNGVNPFDFPVTQTADNCERCPYKVLCWEEPTHVTN